MKTTKMMAIVAVLVFGMTFGSGSMARAATIDPNDPLIPAGLGGGDKFHLVFVTSTSTSANVNASPLIDYYNGFVQGVADSTGSVVKDRFTWKAIGSTAAADANANAFVSAPVYRLDGVQVATGYGDMWNGSIANPINITELKTTTTWSDVWTGTNSDGTARTPNNELQYQNGASWTGDGNPNSAGTAWISAGLAFSATSYPMYALSEELAIPVPEPAGLGLMGFALLAVRRRRS